MKKLILIFLVPFMILFSGCTEKQIIIVPQAEFYPTFNTTDFEEKQAFKLRVWEEEDSNTSYIVGEKGHILDFIRDTKTLRSDYNTLRQSIINFNEKITNLNEEQANKKPYEVDEYDFTK